MEKQLPQKYNGIFESPMTYGMKFSFRLKGESEIQNLWFENRTIPAFIGYMIRAKMFDWYEWKSTKPMVPTSAKPKTPIVEDFPILPKPKTISVPKDPTKPNNISVYKIEWIWEGETDLNSQIRSTLPSKKLLRQWDQACAWFKVSEQLREPEPEVHKIKIDLGNAAVCICHETGIKFAINLAVPVKFHFEMLHPLAMLANTRALIAKYNSIGIKLQNLEPQILAGMLITLLKNHKLYDSNKLMAKVVNEKLVSECSKDLLTLLIQEFYKLKSSIGLPKFDLATTWYFDKQLVSYLAIIKGEDTSVGTGKSPESKEVKVVIETTTTEPAMVQVRRLVKELKSDATPEQKLFLTKIEAYSKVWSGLDEAQRDSLISQCDNKLDLSVKSELLVKNLKLLSVIEFEEKQESKKFDSVSFMAKFGGKK